MSRLAGHSFIYLGSNIVTAALPFALLPVLTRYLDPLEYGQVATFQALFNIAILIVGMNLQGAVSVRKFKGEDADLPTYLGNCVLISLAAAFVILAILLPMQAMVSDALELPSVWLLLLVPCGLAASIYGHRLILWQVGGRPLSYGLFNFGLAAVNLGLSLVFVMGLATGAAGRVVGIVGSTLLFGVLAFLLLRRDRLMDFRWSSAAARSALLFALPLVPHSFAGIAITQADRFLVGQQLGLAEAGIYAVAMQMTLPMVMVADSFNRAYVPWLYGHLGAGNAKLALAVSAAGAGVAVVGTFALIAIAVVVVPVFLGVGFAPAGDLLFWMAPGVAAQAAYYMFINFIFYSERTAAIPIVTVTCAVAYVGFGYLAVRAFGAQGLAAIYSIVGIVQTVAIFVLARKLYPLPWFELDTYRDGFRSLGRRSRSNASGQRVAADHAEEEA